MTTANDALDRLNRALGDGTFVPGDRLPPERDLAVHLGTGRSTLRKALDRLEREGRLRREVGRGTFVTGGEVMTTLRMDPAPGPDDVMELREMIEPQIAGLAALRASPEMLNSLRGLVHDAEGAADWAAWEAADSALHRAIATAARNPLLGAVLGTLDDIRRQGAWRDLRRDTLDARRQADFTRQHKDIIRCIASRSAPRARAAMQAHLGAVRRAMAHPPD